MATTSATLSPNVGARFGRAWERGRAQVNRISPEASAPNRNGESAMRPHTWYSPFVEV